MASRHGFENLMVIGSGAMAARALVTLTGNGMEVDAVVEPEPSGYSSLPTVARTAGVAYKRLMGGRLTEYLLSFHGPSLIFSVNNNYLFPAEVIGRRGVRIVNFHNSLLPGYPGRNVPTWVVYNGEKRHGATWHLVDRGIDTGNILAQEAFEVAPGDTASDVMTRAIRLGMKLFEDNWRRFADPSFAGTPQEGRSRCFKKAEVPNGGWFDRDWDLEEADRFLRAMDYGPFQVVEPPRIKQGSRTLIVRRYAVHRGGGPASVPRAMDGELMKTVLGYSDGVIELSLGQGGDHGQAS